MTDRAGWLKLDRLGARTQLVTIIKETPKRFVVRMESLTTVRRSDRSPARTYQAGEEVMVAKERVFLRRPWRGEYDDVV